MACVYGRRKQYWIGYYVNGRQVKESLHTSNERVVLAKKKRIEYELSLGDLQVASQLPLVPVLEAFCKTPGVDGGIKDILLFSYPEFHNTPFRRTTSWSDTKKRNLSYVIP